MPLETQQPNYLPACACTSVRVTALSTAKPSSELSETAKERSIF